MVCDGSHMKWTTEARLGVFIVVALVATILLTLRFGHYHIRPEGSYRIYADFKSVDGLEKGTVVNIAGVKVGEVTDITLNPNGTAHVEITIFGKLRIPDDVHPVIYSNGFLGNIYIELVPGKSGSTFRKSDFSPTGGQGSETACDFLADWLSPPAWADPVPGTIPEPAPSSSPPPSKTDAAQSAPATTPVSAGPSSSPPPSSPITGSDQTSGGFAAPNSTLKNPGEIVSVNRLIRKLNKIADDIKKITGSLRGAIGTEKGKEDLKKTLDNLAALTENLKEFTKNLKDKSPDILKRIDSIADKIDNGVGTVGQLVNNQSLYNNVNSAAAHLNNILAKIDSGQGTIGKLVNDPEVYNNLNKTLKKLSSETSLADRMVLNVWMRGFYYTRSATADGFFDLDIYPRSDKFYRIQVVSSQAGNYTQSTPYTQVNGQYVAGPSQVIQSNSAIQFSVEFGERFDNFDIRAGLIQNSFGVGTDIFLTKNLTFTFTLYNIGSYNPVTPNPYSRIFLTYTFLNHIWINAGYYNAFNQSVASPLVGGGLIFTDNTLKYLIAGHAP